MPKEYRFFERGFIDIIGLIMVVFLVATVATVTVVTNKEGANFDLRDKAADTIYTSCSQVPEDQCESISGCSLKTQTSYPTVPCSDSDCSSGVSECSFQNILMSGGHCDCDLELSTAKTKDTCKSSPTLGVCTWTEALYSKTCTGKKTVTTTTLSCEGTINTCDNCTLGTKKSCSIEGKAGTQTCVNSEDCIDKVNAGNWGGCVADPAPTSVTTLTSPPECGGQFEPCCGNKQCNSGFWCSDLEGGTCVPQTCTPGQRQCNGGSLGICRADGSRFDYSSCGNFGCDTTTNTCKICDPDTPRCNGSTLQKCNDIGTLWVTDKVCPSNTLCDEQLGICKANSPGASCLEPCTVEPNSCGEGYYCYQPAGGCSVCRALEKVCTPNERQCVDNIAQVCNSQGSRWLSTTCSSTQGCIGGYCVDPYCSQGTDIDCSGLGLHCVPTTQGGKCSDPYNGCSPVSQSCKGESLLTCSNSGELTLEQCAEGCNSDTNKCKLGIGKECQSSNDCGTGNCYAGNQTLAGSPFDSIKKCHAESIETMDKITKDVNTAVAAEGAVLLTAGLGVANLGVGGAIAMANLVDDSVTIGKCIATGDPDACYWAGLALSIPIPGMSVYDDVVDAANSVKKVVSSVDDFLNLRWQSTLPDIQMSLFGQKTPVKTGYDTIEQVRDASIKYGADIKYVSYEGNYDDITRLTRELGYEPKPTNLGDTVIAMDDDGFWRPSPLTVENPVRIGPNKELYIGMDEVYGGSQISSRADLCHDLGACAMGGKVVTDGTPTVITFDEFNLTLAANGIEPLSDNGIRNLFNLDSSAYIINSSIVSSTF